MEFPYVNDFLNSEVTCINGALLPEGYEEEHADDHHLISECREKVASMLDEIGVLSGIAQGLQVPVTSSDKLRNTDHRVYLLTDPAGGENGLLVGLLKVGLKKLFLFDETGRNHEMNPLCTLDFYVHESKQRLGCGKKLYDFMLQSEGVSAHHLALDRPSEKLLSFLSKHYDLNTILPQSNNFVVYENFFEGRSTGGQCNGRGRNTVGYGRPAAGCGTARRDSQISSSRRAVVSSRPHSSISKVFHPDDLLKAVAIDVSDHGGLEEPKLDMGSVSPTLSSPSRCSDTPWQMERKDIKFEHQRLW